MIILNTEKCNTNLNFFDINLDLLKCPHCKSNNFIKWGSYNRNLYYTENNNIIHKVIKIYRVRCKDCGKTHALIPSFIVPYKLHTLDLILKSLLNDDISLSINYDTVSKWNKDLNIFIPYLKTMFNKYTKFEIINLLKQDIFKYYKQYFDINKKILMMIRPGIYDMVYF